MVLSAIRRYDQGEVSRVGDRAVVVGGSVAGLCIARVLTDWFETVTVVERDALPDEPTARRGAPQSHHPHVLLEAGRVTLEDLFPGFGEDVLRGGGLLIDGATDIEYYDEGGFLADGPERLPLYCASRALFEYVVRRRVSALDGVDLRDRCQFIDYLSDPDGTAVTGIELRTDTGERERLSADLVVDASGRTSRTPAWLDRHGYAPPDTDTVEIDLTYTTVVIDRPPEDRRLFMVPPSAPRTRGTVMVPVENERWEVLLQAVNGDETPTDREKIADFTASLPVSEPAALLDSQRWVPDEVHHYPFPTSIRRRYEDLDGFPDGLVVVGDAIASFNPIYGQGMSVAALDALLLHHALAAGGLDDLGTRFFDRAGPVIDDVWSLAAGADFAFSGTTGPKPRGTDFFNWYLSRLLRSAQSDGRLTDAFYRVLRLENSPTTLLHPSVLRRVFSPR